MNREVHVRFWEGLAVRFRRATQLSIREIINRILEQKFRVISPQHQEVAMFTNHINRIRSGLIVGAIAALIFTLPCGVFAQSSLLTVQPSTGPVGVGNTNPQNPM